MHTVCKPAHFTTMRKRNHQYIWILPDHDECICCGQRRYVNFIERMRRKRV